MKRCIHTCASILSDHIIKEPWFNTCMMDLIRIQLELDHRAASVDTCRAVPSVQEEVTHFI